MDPIKESVELLIDTWALFVRRLPTGNVSHSDGIAATLGNVPLPFLNMCMSDSPIEGDEELQRRLRLTLERTADCPYPWLFTLCEDWAPRNWKPAAEAAGLEFALRLTGMATDRLKPPRRPLPELEYRRVNDEATARDLAEINMHAYELPPEMAECICNLHLWTDDSHGYVGYVDGKRVTCSATFPVNGTVYVAFVATLPDAHGKGYAEAVMRHSIEQGSKATGLGRTALHASEAGRALYEAMGYRAHCEFSVLSLPHESG